MEDRKIPFYKRLKLAIFNVEKYQELALENIKVAVKYFLKLILAFTAIVSIAFTYEYITMAKNAIQILKNDIPDFVFENNQLISKAEEATIINSGDDNVNYITIIDTNVDENSEIFTDYIEKSKLYSFGLIFLKDKIVFSTNLDDNLQYISYENLDKNYNINNLDKQSLINKIDSINVAYVYTALYLSLGIYLFISYLISTLLESVLLFILGFLTSKIAGINLKNTQIYIISIYALTLPIILNTIYIPINILTGFEIEYFQIMYTAISYVYLITAILLIRTDLIKQNTEIEKIEDVQKEVRQEMKQKNEQEKKETDDKKNNDENNDVGTNDQAPEGT